MDAENLSVVLHKIGDMRVENRAIPEPESDEVQIRMGAIGICGTDVHFWTNGCVGGFAVKAPMILGHEGSGTVVKAGKNVKHLSPGDRVAIEPAVPCRYCGHCKSGRYNLCPGIKCCATPPIDGNLCLYYTHPADFCYKLPDTVTLDEGALLEPLSVGIHAARRGGVGLGSNVYICGAGPMGLMCLLVVKSMGAAKVAISDLVENRLRVAASVGADYVFNVNNLTPEQIAAAVEEAIGDKPELSIECTGVESALQSAILATRSGGRVVIVGVGYPNATLPILDSALREVDIRGVFRYANCYPAALDMVASGRINVKGIITHHFTLKDSLKAFELSRDGSDGAIKVMINP